MALRKALVVDDNAANLLIARVTLERVGKLQVVTATSGADALEVAAREQPDLILLDVAMPGLGGLEVLALLRGRTETAAIPVVFLTAMAMPADVATLTAAGAVGVITKPFEPMRLTDELRALLELTASQEPRVARGSTNMAISTPEPDVVAANAVALAPAPEPPRAAAARLRVLVIDDEPLCGALVQRALRRTHQVTATMSGADALAWIGNGERYDLILCDLCMPQVSGEDLFRALLRDHPDQAARFTLITGGPTTTAAARFLLEIEDRVLWKPFDQAALLAFVARAAAGREPEAELELGRLATSTQR